MSTLISTVFLFNTMQKNHELTEKEITTYKLGLEKDLANIQDAKDDEISHLKNGNFTYSFVPKKDYSNKKKLFSREVVWFGRKGGKFFHSVSNLSN